MKGSSPKSTSSEGDPVCLRRKGLSISRTSSSSRCYLNLLCSLLCFRQHLCLGICSARARSFILEISPISVLAFFLIMLMFACQINIKSVLADPSLSDKFFIQRSIGEFSLQYLVSDGPAVKCRTAVSVPLLPILVLHLQYRDFNLCWTERRLRLPKFCGVLYFCLIICVQPHTFVHWILADLDVALIFVTYCWQFQVSDHYHIPNENSIVLFVRRHVARSPCSCSIDSWLSCLSRSSWLPWLPFNSSSMIYVFQVSCSSHRSIPGSHPISKPKNQLKYEETESPTTSHYRLW